MNGAAAPAPTLVRRSLPIWNLPISLAVRTTTPEQARTIDAAWAATAGELAEVDAVFSTYRHDSWISRLGRGEVTLAQCPAEVAEVLGLAESARLGSDGVFDVRRSGADGTPRLDPLGLVKGWAVERAARRLLDALPGVDLALNAGGDVWCHTARSDGDPWRIGIEDPRDPTRLVRVVDVRRGAVATSGSAHRGEHVVDARTGRAPTALASVTVVGRSLTWADVDATTAYALDQRAAAWLAARPDRGALLVWRDGTTTEVGDLSGR